MVDLTDLIIYWKERQAPHPPITPVTWSDVLEATIFYLQQLRKLREGKL